MLIYSSKLRFSSYFCLAYMEVGKGREQERKLCSEEKSISCKGLYSCLMEYGRVMCSCFTKSLHGLFWVVLLAQTGCTANLLSIYGDKGLTKDEFSKYVEDVFRFQNQLTCEVMLLDKDEWRKDYNALLQAEQIMHQACQSLNEYADKEGTGERISLLLQRQVNKSVVTCEQAAQNLDALLND